MHFEKFDKNQITKLYEHYTREHITENVIQERIKDNVIVYNENFLGGDSKSIANYNLKNINERYKRKLRDNQVLMVDLIITQPKELGEKVDMKFFEKIIDTFESKYSPKKNRIMYAIHQDEKGQPHCHYSFIPFVNGKNGNEKLCCKEFLTRDFLQKFHEEMEKETGYKLTDPEKDNKPPKNLTMPEYQMSQDRLKEIESKIIDKENRFDLRNLTQNEITIKPVETLELPPMEKVNVLNANKVATEYVENMREKFTQLENENIAKLANATNKYKNLIEQTEIREKQVYESLSKITWTTSEYETAIRQNDSFRKENSELKMQNMKLMSENNELKSSPLAKQWESKYYNLQNQYQKLIGAMRDFMSQFKIDNVSLLQKFETLWNKSHHTKTQDNGLSR